MSSASRSWKICTRTVRDDYFWIDHALTPREPPRASPDGTPCKTIIPPPPLYNAVADASDMRRGYIRSDGQTLEMAVDRLGAQRADRYGGVIKHVLWLIAEAGDTKAADVLRKLFAEAVAEASATAENSVAARLARALFDRWNTQRESPAVAVPEPVDWLEVYHTLNATPRAVSTPSAKWNIQYSRRDHPETVPANLAVLAVNESFQDPGLIVVAGSKYPDQIQSAVRTVLGKLPNRFSFCCLSGNHGQSALPPVTRSQLNGGLSDKLSEGKEMIGDFWKKLPWSKKIAIGTLAVAILWILGYWACRPGGTGSKPVSTPKIKTPQQQETATSPAPPGALPATAAQPGLGHENPASNPQSEDTEKPRVNETVGRSGGGETGPHAQ